MELRVITSRLTDIRYTRAGLVIGSPELHLLDDGIQQSTPDEQEYAPTRSQARRARGGS
jgi:hypothetical protein